MKKISDDGLHFVECNDYDYNEAIGHHYSNLTKEEREEYWASRKEEDDKWLKENGFYD